MPIDAFLTEATWKSAGLTKRTTAEKIKFKKTLVSEALRAYAAVVNLGPAHGAEKQTKLKAIKTVLAKCKHDHATNAAFVAYISNVEKGVGREAVRLNKELSALTLGGILNSDALYAGFHAYCANDQHNPEPLEFLHAVKANTAAPALIATYIRAGAPKEVNVSDTLRSKWVSAPLNPGAKAAVVDEVNRLINLNELPRFRQKMAIRV